MKTLLTSLLLLCTTFVFAQNGKPKSELTPKNDKAPTKSQLSGWGDVGVKSEKPKYIGETEKNKTNKAQSKQPAKVNNLEGEDDSFGKKKPTNNLGVGEDPFGKTKKPKPAKGKNGYANQEVNY